MCICEIFPENKSQDNFAKAIFLLYTKFSLKMKANSNITEFCMLVCFNINNSILAEYLTAQKTNNTRGFRVDVYFVFLSAMLKTFHHINM